jgi:c-di-GMP-related signal transduction protein
VKLLAEKIETAEEFRFCREAGFDYFQGYYFSKPKLFSATEEEVSAGTLSVGLLKLAGIDSTSEYIQ